MNEALQIEAETQFLGFSSLFECIADPHRQKIILLLSRTPKGIPVQTITENMVISRPATSHHLKILKDEGLVQSTKVGTQVLYRLTLAGSLEKLKALTRLLEESCLLGEEK